MGYFQAVGGGGGWNAALVDEVSDAQSLILTDPSPTKANLVVPKMPDFDYATRKPSDGEEMDLGWYIGDIDTDQQNYFGLFRPIDETPWSMGFGIDSERDNLLTYNGTRAPLIFGGEF